MLNQASFETRIEQMIDEIKSSKKAKGVTTIYFPGEIENNKYRECLEKGVVEIKDQTMLAFRETEKLFNL